MAGSVVHGSRRRMVSILGVGALVATLLAVLPPAAEAQGRGLRLAGDDRILTAIEVSEHGFPNGAASVYLARADNFPDALAAGALTDGPILLVPRTGRVPSRVLTEISRLDPTEVVALGGTAAVDQDVLDEAAGTRSQRRIAGGSRFETAVAIAKELPRSLPKVYLARADNFPDALAAGALTDGPVLLVPTSGSVPRAVLDEIERRDPQEVIALGGTGAVSNAVLDAAAQGRSTGRLAGASRIETSVEISQAAFPDTADDVHIAVQSNFPDALSAGALTNGPVILVPSCGSLPTSVFDEIRRLRATRVIALGGAAVVCDSILDQAVDAAVPGAAYLDDMNLVSDSMYRVYEGTYSTDGLTYVDSILLDPNGNDLSEAVWDIGRDFTDFKTTIGVRDDAHSDVSFQWRLFGDGDVLDEGSVQVGGVHPVAVDVTNVLRLRMEVTQTGGPTGGFGDNSLSLGTPRLIVPNGKDDAPAPDDGAPIGNYQFHTQRPLVSETMYRVYEDTYSTDGLTYVESILLDPNGNDLSEAVWDIGRDFTDFKTTIGVHDDAHSDATFSWTLRDDTTGMALAQGTAQIGDVAQVDVDVSDVLRLRMEATQTGGPTGGFGDNSLTLGTPRLILPDGSDTAPAPTDGTPVGSYQFHTQRPLISETMYRVYEGTYSTDGLTYVESILLDPDGNDLSEAVWDIGRDFTDFKTTIGVHDDADGATTFSWVLRDDTTGVALAQGPAQIGDVTAVDVDVTDVLRLRMEVTQTGGPTGGFGDNSLTLGTPRLILPGGTDTAPDPT